MGCTSTGSARPDIAPVRTAPNHAPSALVLGLDSTVGLQTSRILARRGVRIVGIAADGRHPACRTNTCHRLVVAPSQGEGLLAALERLAISERGAVLFPCTDAGVHTLAHATDRLGAFRSILPSAEVVATFLNRRRFLELAELRGLPIAPARVVQDLAEARAAAVELRFPCVARPWATARHQPRQHLRDPGAWLAAAAALLDNYGELTLQERLPGGDEQVYTCNCYVSPRGVPIVTFVARNLRQRRHQLGSASVGEAFSDQRIRDLALEVLSLLPFRGLGYVAVHRDPSTGEDRLVDVRVGRPTVDAAMAEASGVELLFTLYRDAIGAPLPLDRRQHDRQVTWLRLGRDVPAPRQYLGAGAYHTGGWAASARGRTVVADLDPSDLRPFTARLVRASRGVAPPVRPVSTCLAALWYGAVDRARA